MAEVQARIIIHDITGETVGLQVWYNGAWREAEWDFRYQSEGEEWDPIS